MITSRYRSWRDDAILEARHGVRMSVHEGVRRCAAFLSKSVWDESARAGYNVPFGTVFFVWVNLDPNASYAFHAPHAIYAVTAKHCIVDIPEHQEFYIVTNKLGGGYNHLPTRRGDWKTHPDTDVAVCELIDSQTMAATTAVPLDWLVTKSRREPQNTLLTLGDSSFIALGDDTYTVGFYVGFYGRSSVQPIVRYGRVSLMPNDAEKIKVEMCKDDEGKDYDDLPEIEAYLVEMMAWEGQSGSPVFVSFGRLQEGVQVFHDTESVTEAYQKLMDGVTLEEERQVILRSPSVCIGLVQGYHPTDIQMLDARTGGAFKLNLGLSIVVPSDKIVEVLMEDELVAERKRRLEKLPKVEKKPLRPARATLSGKKGEGATITREGFEEALRRASRKTSSQPESESDET